MEKDIAYWSGANGAESARCLIQYMEDMKDMNVNLTLFYSNPTLYTKTNKVIQSSVNVIYYEWLIKMARKLDNFRVIFTFTREREPPVHSDHPRVIYRNGRFFVGPDGTNEKTLSKYL